MKSLCSAVIIMHGRRRTMRFQPSWLTAIIAAAQSSLA
jgi:hypothetical protein